MINLSKTYLIQEENFNNAWYQAIQNVLKGRVEFKFGSHSEPKIAWDSCQLIELTGKAIKQIENHEIHPKYPFKSIEQYCNEMTWEFARDQRDLDNNDERKMDYTYADRLMLYDEYDEHDQLFEMKLQLEKQIKTNISSNYNQAITWYAGIDGSDKKASPCLQRIWLRWYPENLIDLHYEWRSRDLYNAWQSNIIALTEMMNREVIRPNDCKIARIADYSDSLHIYEANLKEASKVDRIYTFHGGNIC